MHGLMDGFPHALVISIYAVCLGVFGLAAMACWARNRIAERRERKNGEYR